MGYRSDVAYRIRFAASPEGESKFKLFLAEIKSREDTRIAVDELYISEKDRELHFEAEAVKWYDSYQDVASHQALWRVAEEYDRQWCEENPKSPRILDAAFVRVGESNDDVEEDVINNGFDLLQVSRTIVWM